MRQEVGWFDFKTNSTGVLTGKLASEAVQVCICISFISSPKFIQNIIFLNNFNLMCLSPLFFLIF